MYDLFATVLNRPSTLYVHVCSGKFPTILIYRRFALDYDVNRQKWKIAQNNFKVVLVIREKIYIKLLTSYEKCDTMYSQSEKGCWDR